MDLYFNFINLTTDRSGDENISCENVSRPRNMPQIDSDSRCALVFSTVSLSANGRKIHISPTSHWLLFYYILAYILQSWLNVVCLHTFFANRSWYRLRTRKISNHFWSLKKGVLFRIRFHWNFAFSAFGQLYSHIVWLLHPKFGSLRVESKGKTLESINLLISKIYFRSCLECYLEFQ